MNTSTFYKLHAVFIFYFLTAFFLADTIKGQTCNNAVWYNTSWLYRKAITIDYTKVGTGPHTNFAVLINITDSDLQARALANYNDILFTASDGTTKLAHEVESYTSSTGALVAWVQIPSLSSTANTIIYMYYGNSGAAAQQNITGTWNTNYKGVYHLNSGGTDATSNASNLTLTGTMNYGSAVVANGGTNFVSGGTNYFSRAGLMSNPSSITLSGWAYLTSIGTNGSDIVSLGDNALIRYDKGAGKYSGVVQTGASSWQTNNSTTSYALNAWHYIVYTYTANAQQLYLDGVANGLSSSNTSSPYYGGTNTYIGLHGNGDVNNSFVGKIDEVRVSNSVRSAGWILTEYNNQNSPATFYSVGSQQSLKIFTGTGNFSTAARWTNSVVPVACDYLIIEGTCTVDNNSTTNNVAYGPLVIGYTAARTLNWIASGTNTLNVTNVSSAFASSILDMTNGGTLKINGTWTSTNLTFTSGAGTIEIVSTLTLPAAYTTYNNLTITGGVTLGVATTIKNNFVNNGTFTNGGFRVTFTGTSGTSSSISGTAATTDFSGGLTVNKGASTDVLDVQCVITMIPTSTLTQLTLTQGTFKLSSASTITPFWVNNNSSPYDIPAATTFWCNNASAVVNSTGSGGTNGGSWSIGGTLHVTAGTVNVGTAADDWLATRSGSTLIVDGGNLNVAGRIGQTSENWTFMMSSGTIVVPTVGTTLSGKPPFHMEVNTQLFNMSGGTLIIRREGGTASSDHSGYSVVSVASGSSFTGGTLQIGDASTPASQTIGIVTTIPIYNLTVNGSNSPTAQLQTNSITVTNNVTITSGTLNPNTLNISVGRNWTNNATYSTSTSGVIFNGTANQTIGGSNSTTFYNLTLNNTGTSGNNVITLSKAITASNTLTLTDGILATSATNLLTLTNSSSSATTGGNSSGPSFVQGPMRWNGLIGTGPFIFPTGAGTSTWARVAVSGITSATDFTAQYFNSSYTNVATSFISTSSTLSITTVSKVEYWDVARTSGTGNAAVTLYWENASTSYINSCASNGNLKVAHFNSSSTNKWENANSSGSVTVTGSCSGSSAGTVKSDVMSSFSPFSFGSGGTGVNPLPIELLSFDAVFNGKTIDLKWVTASEINNNYFTIERSSNGVDYTIVGIVSSKAENGHSTSVINYTLNDPNTETGTYYYRLKQTDFDYKYVYSNVIVASITENIDFTFDMAPNPNDGNQMAVHITTPQSGTVALKIYDMSGKLLFTENAMITEGKNNSFLVRFKETLTSGTYIVIVSISDELSKKKRMVVGG